MVNPVAQLEAEELDEEQFNANDEEQVNTARKTAGRKKVKDREALVKQMSTIEGRSFMWNCVRCLFIGSPVVPNDSFSTYFNLGQEHTSRALFKEMAKVCPEKMTLMLEENAKKYL